jgi:hypothetical protein
MSRQRNARSDWATYSQHKRDATAAGAYMLHTGKCSLCHVELSPTLASICTAKACPLKEPAAPRARPVQHEASEARSLAVQAYGYWWWPGMMRWEAATASVREGERRTMEGGKTGWPDFGVFVPRIEVISKVRPAKAISSWTRQGEPWRHVMSEPIMLAIELKAPLPGKRRKPMEPEWWLEGFGDAGSRLGLRRDQAQWLRVLHGCGFRTCVAYGAAEALSWIVEQCGPKPDELPEGW